jgi:hypothetical protein
MRASAQAWMRARVRGSLCVGRPDGSVEAVFSLVSIWRILYLA